MGLKRSYAIVGFFLAAAIILGSCTGGDRTKQTFIVDPIDTTMPGTWNTDYLRDYHYAEGRIFDLFYPEDEIGPYDRVYISIFEVETRNDNPDAREVYLKTRTDQPSGGPYDNSLVRMREITATEGWELLYGQDTTRSPVAIYFYASKRRAIGVHMVVTGLDAFGNTTGLADTIGHKSDGTVADPMDTLRVLRPMSKDMYPDNPAWTLMWRNCYRVPRNIATEDIDLKIFKGLPGREGVASNLDYQHVGGVAGHEYIRILGLDQVINDNTSRRISDGRLDPFTSIHRPDWGLVIFPEREPFNSSRTFLDDSGEPSDRLRDTVWTIYDYSSTTEKLQDSKYYLQVRTWRPDYVR